MLWVNAITNNNSHDKWNLTKVYLRQKFIQKKNKPLKRGRGSQCKSKVHIMAESTFVENPKKWRKPKQVSYIKMIVINDLKSNTITVVVKE